MDENENSTKDDNTKIITNEVAMNLNLNNSTINVVPTRDRDWLKILLQKHSKDLRIQLYHEQRIQQYPILQNKALVLAPMVDQSDLPFRLLCRNYGTNLCFTPMIHAKMLCTDKAYRKKFWNRDPHPPQGSTTTTRISCQDRPLIVQLCGSDKYMLEQAIRIILGTAVPISTQDTYPIDGIDINCGCPQDIARRGKYGAFLLEQEELLVDLVRHLAQTFYPLPISVKVRLLPTGNISDSLHLYTRLVDAGAAMLTIHGRHRHQKGHLTGPANWDAIKQAVQLLGHRIPILANGSIYNLDTVQDCLQQTGADGVMSSEAILEYPAMFTLNNIQLTQGKRLVGPGRIQLTREYLHLCKEFPPEKSGQGNGLSTIRAHLFKLLFQDTQEYTFIRDALARSKTFDDYVSICNQVEEIHEKNGHVVENEDLSWYFRHWKNHANQHGSKSSSNNKELIEKRIRRDSEEEEDESMKEEEEEKKDMEYVYPTKKEMKWSNDSTAATLRVDCYVKENQESDLKDACCYDEC